MSSSGSNSWSTSDFDEVFNNLLNSCPMTSAMDVGALNMQPTDIAPPAVSQHSEDESTSATSSTGLFVSLATDMAHNGEVNGSTTGTGPMREEAMQPSTATGPDGMAGGRLFSHKGKRKLQEDRTPARQQQNPQRTSPQAPLGTDGHYQHDPSDNGSAGANPLYAGSNPVPSSSATAQQQPTGNALPPASAPYAPTFVDDTFPGSFGGAQQSQQDQQLQEHQQQQHQQQHHQPQPHQQPQQPQQQQGIPLPPTIGLYGAPAPGNTFPSLNNPAPFGQQRAHYAPADLQQAPFPMVNAAHTYSTYGNSWNGMNGNVLASSGAALYFASAPNNQGQPSLQQGYIGQGQGGTWMQQNHSQAHYPPSSSIHVIHRGQSANFAPEVSPHISFNTILHRSVMADPCRNFPLQANWSALGLKCHVRSKSIVQSVLINGRKTPLRELACGMDLLHRRMIMIRQTMIAMPNQTAPEWFNHLLAKAQQQLSEPDNDSPAILYTTGKFHTGEDLGMKTRDWADFNRNFVTDLLVLRDAITAEHGSSNDTLAASLAACDALFTLKSFHPQGVAVDQSAFSMFLLCIAEIPIENVPEILEEITSHVRSRGWRRLLQYID